MEPKKKLGYPLSIPLGMVLAASGGYMDAYSYLARGKVLANAQTGNIMLLGISLAEGTWDRVLHYACPVAAFGIGILLAYFLTQLVWRDRHGEGTCTILALEIAGLFAVAWIEPDLYANALISLVCGMQLQAFSTVGGNGAATTMCIGNYRLALQWAANGLQTQNPTAKQKAAVHGGIILFFVLGAICSSRVIDVAGEWAIWGSCVRLLLAMGMKILGIQRSSSPNVPSEIG